MDIKLKDGTVQEVIEEKCESTKIVAIFDTVNEMEVFRKKLTNDNLSDFKYQKDDKIIGEYESYTFENTTYVENDGSIETTFSIRALTDVETRLAAVEQGQEAQDAAICDLAEMMAGGEQNGQMVCVQNQSREDGACGCAGKMA